MYFPYLTTILKHCSQTEIYYIQFLTLVLQPVLNAQNKFKIETRLHNSTHNDTLQSISKTEIAAKIMEVLVMVLGKYGNMIK